MYKSLYEITGDIKDINKIVVDLRTLKKLEADTKRLSFLNNNFYYREKDKFDTMRYTDFNQWSFFAPPGVQGDVRNVIDKMMENE